MFVTYNTLRDNTIYCCRETTESVLKNLQLDLKRVLDWFGNNQIMANSGKFQYKYFGIHRSLKIEIENFKLESVMLVKHLGLTIDHY